MNDTAPSRDVKIISLIGGSHAVSHFFQLALPSLFPWLIKDFSLDYTTAGFLMTLFFVISGVGQAMAGFVVDRFGPRPVLFGGMGLLGVSGVLLALAQNVPMLAVAVAVAGLGNCVFHPVDFTLLNRLVSEKRLPHGFSTHALLGTLGWAAAPGFMVGMATLFSWKAAWLAAAAVAFTLLALLWLSRDLLHAEGRPAPAKGAGAAASGSRFEFLRSPPVWMCFAFFLMATMASGALQNFGPSALGHVYGLSLAVATSALTAYLLANACGMFFGGFVASRNQAQDRVVAMGLAVAAIGATVLAADVLPGAGVLPVMVVMGLSVGIASPSRDLLIRKSAIAGAGSASFGRIYGFVYSGMDVGLAVSPAAFGLLMDAGRYQDILAGVALFQGLAILTVLRVGTRTRSGLASAKA